MSAERVPAALVDAAEQSEQVERVDAAAPGDAVLAVGREGEVLVAHRAAGADLRGLLAEQAGPDAELALPLQRGGLGVDAPGHDQVAVEALDRLVVEVEGEVRVLDALALGGQQLDQLGSGHLRGPARRPHRGRDRNPSLVTRTPLCRRCPGIAGTVGSVGRRPTARRPVGRRIGSRRRVQRPAHARAQRGPVWACDSDHNHLDDTDPPGVT